MRTDDQGIGHREQGRRVEQDQVVVRTDPLQQAAEVQVQEEFRAVRWQLPGRDEIEVLHHVVVDDFLDRLLPEDRT